MDFEVVVAGHICLDIIPEMHGPPPEEPGTLVEVGPATLSTGGAVGNAGLALHVIGVPTALMGKIGDDPLGRALQEVIARFDPQLTRYLIIAPGESSSYTVVINPPNIDRSFLHCPALNNTFSSSDIPYDQVAKARLFHFGYPVLMRRTYEDQGAELCAMFRRAKEVGVTTSLDVGPPDPRVVGHVDWARIMRSTLPYVDVFVPSADELQFVLDRRSFENKVPLTTHVIADLGQESIRMGAKVVVIKCGDRGFYLRTASQESFKSFGRAIPANEGDWADREMWSPCFVPDVFAGTTGTGDATIAGFIAALLRGCSVSDTATFACAVGACCVEAPNAIGGIRSWEETWNRVRRGWRRAKFQPDEEGWRHDALTSLWVGPRDGRRVG